MNTGYEGIRRRYDTAVFEKHTLANGITIWMQKSPILVDESGILIVVLPGVGSQLDPPDKKGTAHFFEHIPFRGTRKKPSSQAIIKPISLRGGSMSNTNITRERTQFCIQNLAPEDFELAVETLYEMVTCPLITENDVRLEIGTIMKEYERGCADGNRMTTRTYIETFYGSKHPLGHLPVGYPNTIENMSTELLWTFHKNHYHSGNIHIICGGAFSKIPSALSCLEKSFGKLSNNASAIPDIDWYGNTRITRLAVIEPQCKRDWLILRYSIPMRTKADRPNVALRALASILGDGVDSPLMEELRTKRGLIYGSGLCDASSKPRYLDFTMFAPVAAENFGLVQEIFKTVLKRLATQTIVDAFMGRQLKRRIAFDHPINTCRNIVEEIVKWGKPFSFAEDEEAEDKVTLEEIFNWRDYLLHTEPQVLEIRTK